MNEIIQMLLRLSKDLEFIKAFIQTLNASRTEEFKGTWLDGQDVMQLLHISKRCLQSLRNTNTLPFSRINGKIYYNIDDIEGLLQSNYSAPGSSTNRNPEIHEPESTNRTQNKKQ